MTTQEVNEKFKEVKLKFASYFKYTFSVTGTAEEGYEILCEYGGEADMIYRFSLSDIPVNFGSVDDWTSVEVYHNKKQVYSINNS
jgi:hypothetical protein